MNLHHRFGQIVAAPSKSLQAGFILPALVVFSLVLATMGVVALQYITASSSAVQSTNFTAVAKSAADAGIKHALSCLETKTAEWTSLKPNTDCVGSVPASSSASDIMSKSGAWRSTYDVAEIKVNENDVVVTSTGRVDFFYAGATSPSKTFTATSKASIPTSGEDMNVPMASGNVVTQVSAGNGVTCAVANMHLYCSGIHSDARIPGVAHNASNYDTNPRLITTPNLYGTDAANRKTISDVQMGAFSHCAMTNGQSYCWGRNDIGNFGNNSPNTTNHHIPIAPSNAGNFSSNQSRIASPGKSWNNSFLFSCFLNQLRVFCAGDNTNAALGRVFIECPNIFGFCTGAWNIRDDPDHSLPHINRNSWIPQQVYGFATANEPSGNPPYQNTTFLSQSNLYQSRPTHVESGAYSACTLINSRTFCWGDRFINTNIDINGYPHDIGNVKASSGWRGGTDRLASSVGVGESTSCLVSNGELYCWGWRPGNGTRATSLYGVDNPSAHHVRWNLIKASNGSGTDLRGVNVEGFQSHSDNYMCAYGDGDAYCWGPGGTAGNASPNLSRPARVVAGSSASDINRPAVTDVSTGFDQICMVANGSQYCRGHNNYTGATPNRRGMLGTGTLTNHTASNTTVKSSVIGLDNADQGALAATKISSGDHHSCAIANNYIYCWGDNTYGKLGVGDQINKDKPHGITPAGFDARGATHVAPGRDHTCAIISGEVWCWGRNTNGQLGNGTNANSNVPVKASIPSGYKATSIDTGPNHTCAVANGRAYCWGHGAQGQLGHGTTSGSNVPVGVSGLSSGNPSSSDIPTHITTGVNFSCAIANARAYCWGANDHGQIGLPASGTRILSPNLVPDGTPAVAADRNEWTSLEAGGNFTCGAINQVVRCWGNNSNGQLGRGSTASSHVPTSVTGPTGQDVRLKTTTRLTAGASHACAIADGEAHCWGAGGEGRLGDGATATRNDARRVMRNNNFLLQHNIYDISAGSAHTCGIANGRIICWGRNVENQLGDGTNSQRTTPSSWQGNYIRLGRSIDIANATTY